MILLGLLAAVATLVAWTTWLARRLAVAPRWHEVLGERRGRWVRRATVGVVVGAAVLVVAVEVVQRLVDPAAWRPVFWLGLTWVAVLWYLTLTLAVVALVCGVLRLAGRREARDAVARYGALGAVVVTLGVTGYGLVEAGQVRTTHYDLAVEDLDPALDGTTVAFVSDLHVGPVRDADFTRSVVERVNAEEPDLVVLGGDYADGREQWVGPYLDPLGDLDPTWGTVAVTGNHEFINGDAGATMERLAGLGATVLDNRSIEVGPDGTGLVVAGVQDESGQGDDAPDPDAALAGTDPDDAILYVAHQPLQVVGDRGVDVQLSGHTHGGQLWPFGFLVGLVQPTVAGVDRVEDVLLVTGRGAGAWGPPVRVAAPPEVVVVTLHAAD